MMRYGLLRMLRRRQSLLTPNIPKAKLLHVRTVHWNSWGDEGHLRCMVHNKYLEHEDNFDLRTKEQLSSQPYRCLRARPGHLGPGGLPREELCSAGQVKEALLSICEGKLDVIENMIKELDTRSREVKRKELSDEVLQQRSRRIFLLMGTPGNKDPEDHLSIFSAAAEQEEWPMPVWCKMFRQTLSGSARNWFDSLDPKSVDGFEELSNKFLEEFSQQKRYDKDPTEIHGIKRKPNEGLQAFMDRFKAESAHIKGVPPVLRISAFMHGHGHPELAKKLNDKIPKTVDEMWERVRAFIRGETAADTTKAIRSPRWEKSAGKASWSENQNGSRNRSHRRGEGRNMGTCAPYARREGFTPLTKTPKEILAMDNVNFPPPPPMVGTLEKRNMNKFCDYHQDRGHNTNDCYHLKKQIEEAVASGRLAHLVKDIRQGGQKGKGSAKGKEKVINMVRSQGYRKRPYERVEHWMDNAIALPRIHVDVGSSSEVMYEHCFRNLSYRKRSR
ncbi:reverse transcriptase domain-containing protein [Tanacetum coccineum]